MFYNFTLNENTYKIEIMKKILITFFTVLFCLISSVGWSVECKDLGLLGGLYYKKINDGPFTGKTKGLCQGTLKNGKKDGSWVYYFKNGKLKGKGYYKNGSRESSWVHYWNNGQLLLKGNYKNDKRDGSWVYYKKDGTLKKGLSGTYKDGKKISN
jgi:hypothetical protein